MKIVILQGSTNREQLGNALAEMLLRCDSYLQPEEAVAPGEDPAEGAAATDGATSEPEQTSVTSSNKADEQAAAAEAASDSNFTPAFAFAMDEEGQGHQCDILDGLVGIIKSLRDLIADGACDCLLADILTNPSEERLRILTPFVEGMNSLPVDLRQQLYKVLSGEIE